MRERGGFWPKRAFFAVFANFWSCYGQKSASPIFVPRSANLVKIAIFNCYKAILVEFGREGFFWPSAKRCPREGVFCGFWPFGPKLKLLNFSCTFCAFLGGQSGVIWSFWVKTLGQTDPPKMAKNRGWRPLHKCKGQIFVHMLGVFLRFLARACRGKNLGSCMYVHDHALKWSIDHFMVSQAAARERGTSAPRASAPLGPAAAGPRPPLPPPLLSAAPRRFAPRPWSLASLA